MPQPVAITNTGGGALNWTAAKTQTWLTLSAGSGAAPASLSIGVNASGLAAGTYNDTVTVTASGASGSPATIAVTLYLSGATSVSFVKMDTQTQGNWTSSYGADGYNFVGATPVVPTWMQMAINGASSFIWTSSSSEPRALQQVTGTNRVAAVWYSSSPFSICIFQFPWYE